MGSPEVASTAVVVHVGFSGTRHLAVLGAMSADDEARLAEAVVGHLNKLPRRLGLGPHHQVCGLSQVALGSDLIFTRACRSLRWTRRVWLPEPLDRFVAAVGKRHGPDFPGNAAAEALEQAEGPDVLEVRSLDVVGGRRARFEEVGLAMLDEVDVLVVLLPNMEAPDRTKGSFRLRDLAVARGIPLLEMTWTPAGAPSPVEVVWHIPRTYVPPALPDVLATACGTDDPVGTDAWLESMLTVATEHAEKHRDLFEFAALWIPVSHAVATTLALVTAYLHLAGFSHGVTGALLACELIVLVWGAHLHRRLHAEGHSHRWATAGMAREFIRSARGFVGLNGAPDALANVQVGGQLKTLVRTLAWAHLVRAKAVPVEPERYKAAYIGGRIRSQMGYFENRTAWAAGIERRANRAYWTFVPVAIVAVVIELATKVGGVLGDGHHGSGDVAVGFDGMGAVLVGLTVLLPVYASGAASRALASDASGRRETFRAMRSHLEGVKVGLERASGETEIRRIVLASEASLLAEVMSWASRRAYTGVA